MGTSVVILTIVIIVCSIVGSIAQATLSGITAKENIKQANAYRKWEKELKKESKKKKY